MKLEIESTVDSFNYECSYIFRNLIGDTSFKLITEYHNHLRIYSR